MTQLKLSQFLKSFLDWQLQHGAQEKRVIIFSGLLSGLMLVSISVFISAAWVVNEFQVATIKITPERQALEGKTKTRPAAKDDYFKKEISLRSGDTIISALARAGVAYEPAYKFFQAVKPIYDLKKISAGKKFFLSLSSSPGGEIEKFKYEIDVNRYVEVFRDAQNNCFCGKIITIPYDIKREIIKGEITYSLFESILECGERPELADLLASLFEYDVDFNRDIQEGDSFAVIVEKRFLNGQFSSYGNVLASEFTNRGKTIRLLRYTDPEGMSAYYHPDGRSVRKMFLRCPLPFMRVTSRYGNRHHPVLGFSARHNGVDFGAPAGTIIRASAAGVIQAIGYDSGRGRYISIRHPNFYTSHYYHLSGVAKDIKTGTKVDQGQLIGYVGSTGLSTGPHLHYGMEKSGRFFNPLQLESPAKEPVNQKYFEDFRQFANRYFLVLAGSKLVNIPKTFQHALLDLTPTRPVQTIPSLKI
ncbi:MAG TPA: M23 family metallopeptidase [Candidatus Deferrimicrobium sp.]|nr:M23 family metallopeptidase [Candidatus Deferrimicrobium sp.]